jgi:hypothetical protein
LSRFIFVWSIYSINIDRFLLKKFVLIRSNETSKHLSLQILFKCNVVETVNLKLRAKQFRVPVSTTFCNYFIEKISIQIIHQNKERKKTERKKERLKDRRRETKKERNKEAKKQRSKETKKQRNKEAKKQRSKETKKQKNKETNTETKKTVYIKFHVHPFAT